MVSCTYKVISGETSMHHVDENPFNHIITYHIIYGKQPAIPVEGFEKLKKKYKNSNSSQNKNTYYILVTVQ